jgi:hypothetical protein
MDQQHRTPLEVDNTLHTIAEATRVCVRHGLVISEAALKVAADRGELPMQRTVDRGVRLFRAADLRAFIKARCS